MNKIDVKLKLIEVGTRIILEKGYNAAGLQQVLAEADIPKGSFYYYFKSKEDFCISIIGHYVDQYKTNKLSVLFNQSICAYDRLFQYFYNEVEYYNSQDCQYSCLIVKLIVEMSNISTAIRDELQRGIKIWAQAIAYCLRDGLIKNDFHFTGTPENMAESVQSGWIGAMILMQASQSKIPLEDFVEHLKVSLNT
jgi:TetR/AcrR family transcriptional repressor of nem operon